MTYFVKRRRHMRYKENRFHFFSRGSDPDYLSKINISQLSAHLMCASCGEKIIESECQRIQKSVSISWP